MIIDTFENAKPYYSANPLFEKVFEFLAGNDLAAMEPGNYEIRGEDAFLIIAADAPREEFTPRLEAHRKYIDIQFAIEGSFEVGWKALADCGRQHTEFDSENDFILYNDESEFFVPLRGSNFCILFPQDAHVPMPPKSALKKGIVKVLV